MTPADLADSYAVVVGCEDYPIQGWQLNGPASDALDIGAWLVQAGMPAENLHLLASPLSANQAAFDAARARLGNVVFHGAAASGVVKDVFKKRILQAVKAGGSLKRAGLLLVFWSGHGIVQHRHAHYDRIVFCTDVEPNALECIAIPKIVDWLESELPSFKLIFLIDACASDSSRLGIDPRLCFVDLPEGKRTGKPQRFLAYAAAPGEVARNQSGKQRGVFTSALLTHLKDFHPANSQQFCDIDRVVLNARDTINGAHTGRQSVAWDMVDWKGNRGASDLSPAVPHDVRQAPPAESAASLCDRKHQWAEFQAATRQHQSTRPRRPMLVLAHGDRNQASSDFLSNLSHRIREANLWAGTVSVIDHLLMLDQWSALPQKELDDQLTFRLGKILQARPGETLEDLAARISARRSTWLFFIQIESRLLRRDAGATLAPLLRFWAHFPDVDDGALVVLIHIEYPATRRGILPRFLHQRLHPDRGVRAAVVANDFSAMTAAPILCLPTELGMVTLDDVATWAAEIGSIHRSWGRPTEREMAALFRPNGQRAMDEIVRQLKFFIQEGRFNDSSKAY